MKCPISNKVIKVPVTSPNGHIYDEQSVKQYFKESTFLNEEGLKLEGINYH